MEKKSNCKALIIILILIIIVLICYIVCFANKNTNEVTSM